MKNEVLNYNLIFFSWKALTIAVIYIVFLLQEIE